MALEAVVLKVTDGGDSKNKLQDQLYDLNKKLYDYVNSERYTATMLGKEVIKAIMTL